MRRLRRPASLARDEVRPARHPDAEHRLRAGIPLDGVDDLHDLPARVADGEPVREHLGQTRQLHDAGKSSDNFPHDASPTVGCVRLYGLSMRHGEPAKGFPRYARAARLRGLPAPAEAGSAA